MSERLCAARHCPTCFSEVEHLEKMLNGVGEQRDKLYKELQAALIKNQELVEAAGPVLQEMVKANPYDRRDVRFPSKAEVRLRKAVENCIEIRRCDCGLPSCRTCGDLDMERKA